MRTMFRLIALSVLALGLSHPLQASTLTNLVVNGNFEVGDTGFSSDYTYVTPEGNNCWEPGIYTITTSAASCHALWEESGDHTTGDGKFMAINGRTDRISEIWLAEFAVQQDTDYVFEAFVKNLCCDYASFPNTNLLFYANDSLLGAIGGGLAGVWEGIAATWNSGSAEVVRLTALNQSTAFHSNDYGLDDISFTEEQPTPTPEPATMGLVLTGVAVLARRLKGKHPQPRVR